ncbi:hypothetical protein G7Y89_g53 [Cudoniella acicularis]|uniref:Major facilitator superfamily (MFS) profile domain-containing protein n=1 Tax=Cudoniella acicularis TaxID=354080 RepID=A0A8H4WBI8_9HELO|nr:hypothetical protein G7Y89_g53 [Cudoniella acicularis]
MTSQHPTTPQSAKSTAEDSSDLATTEAGKISHDVAITENPSKPDNPQPDSQPKQSTTMTILLLVSVLSSTFLVALDRTIISTAIPQITDDFNSLTDVGWYGSAYLLTFCAFQLLFGKIYTFFSVKAVLLTSILVFEVASAICGAAPNSIAFIVGRAIAGVGAAGIMTGTIVCIVYVVPLRNRPQIQGLFGALFGIAAIMGPLVGGAFTSNVTWRWCFYINLPLGGMAMIIIAPFLNIPDRDTTKLPLTEKLRQLDALGTTFLVPGVVCLLLALQWGGQKYDWGNGRIIALLALTGVLLVAFSAVQILLPTTATLPPRIFKQRSVVAALISTLCIGSGNYIFVYFLPIWFQSIKGVTAAESGIRLLPLMLSMVFGSISGGLINSKIGYYTPLAIIGSCIMSVGAGLLTTLQVDTGEAKWLGYQILYGIGLGLCFQVPNLATQTALPKKYVPIGLALMLFGQLLGAAVFVAVGENVLSNQLVQRLSEIPGFNSSLITEGGATSLLGKLPGNLQETVLTAYNEALRKVFQVGLIVSCFAALSSATLEWRSIKKPEAKIAAEVSGVVEK